MGGGASSSVAVLSVLVLVLLPNIMAYPLNCVAGELLLCSDNVCVVVVAAVVVVGTVNIESSSKTTSLTLI